MHKKNFLCNNKLVKLTKGIEKSLEDFRKSLKGKSNPEEQREIMVMEIRNHFLRYFVNVFKNYDKFIIAVEDPSVYECNIREIFKENDFISTNNKSKSDFYSDFFQTRLWVKFLEMKKIPEQLMHWINIQIFDESIIK